MVTVTVSARLSDHAIERILAQFVCNDLKSSACLLLKVLNWKAV